MIGSVFGGMVDLLGKIPDYRHAEEMQEDTQQFNLHAAGEQRLWQERQRATQYQTAVNDMRAAGLNPALAYQQGGAGTPSGGAASSGITSGKTGPTNFATAFQSAAQAQLWEAETRKIDAEAKRIEAEEAEIRTRTPVHAWTAEKMRQEIAESIERVQDIQQRVRTGGATAANLEQLTRNLAEEIPRIREQVKLINAQGGHELFKAGKTTAEESEIRQRIQANLPAAQEALTRMEAMLKRYQEPGARLSAEAQRSFLGSLDRAIRSLRGALQK